MTLQTCARTIYAGVDGGSSGGSSMCRPWREDHHRHQRKFIIVHIHCSVHHPISIPNWKVFTQVRPGWISFDKFDQVFIVVLDFNFLMLLICLKR